ncbi:Smr/MutS family protein [Brevundimonas naejangsanensis]|uniref:Smr/MutS family protein n=1 Tax=Brevundimonas naejangsanensis TaxID=588932 RepID=UPI003209C9BD
MARPPSGKRPPKAGSATSEDDRRIWGRVTATVTPPAQRKAARVTPGAVLPAIDDAPALTAPPQRGVAGKKRTAALTPASAGRSTTPASLPRASEAARPPIAPRAQPAPEELEPGRKRRLTRERDPIEARIDLHGFGRFEAEDQLRGFLIGCQMRGLRSVLVITGQGRRGGGIIRASVHEWLTGPHLRGVVSGFAPAHRRHGGDGALYVTLKGR